MLLGNVAPPTINARQINLIICLAASPTRYILNVEEFRKGRLHKSNYAGLAYKQLMVLSCLAAVLLIGFFLYLYLGGPA
jgi:predicted Co/Zn/Cd cation transporter (cation efflux family)